MQKLFKAVLVMRHPHALVPKAKQTRDGSNKRSSSQRALPPEASEQPMQHLRKQVIRILSRLFALERFQDLKCKSQVVTCLPEWENRSRLECVPVFTH